MFPLQEGLYSLYLSGSTYATFGPFPDQCITAPHSCTLGFSIGLWIKKMSACASNYVGIVTTQILAPSQTEGMWIRCCDAVTDIEYRVHAHPQFMSNLVMTLGSGPDVWFYATIVWFAGQPLKVYEDGMYRQDGLVASPTRDINTQGMITFGSQYTDHISGHATAYVDGVRIFNRPLSDPEVQALYDSYPSNG